jgi:hypothetical protein
MAEAKKIESPKPETIKFGPYEEASKIKKSDGSLLVTVKKGDVQARYAEKGFTAEVQKVAKEAMTAVGGEAIDAAVELSKKNGGADVKVKLGGGDFAQSLQFCGKKEVTITNPQTHEQKKETRYGTVAAKIEFPWGKEWKGKGGKFESVADEMAAFFTKKK